MNTRKLTEGASSAAQPCELQTSTRSDVQRRDSMDDVPGAEHTQIVVEVHPAAQNVELKVLGDRDTGTGCVRSSAPELRTVTTSDDHAAARTPEPPRQKRQFVVVTVADDVNRRLTTHAGVHAVTAAASSGVHRSGSCTLPSSARSPTSSRRRFVISLMNLDTDKSNISSRSVGPQCRPTVLSSLQSSVASGCSSDQTASLTVAVEASSSTSSRCVTAPSDGDWREASNELWSLRAMLANHDDTSVDESVDEATTTTTTATSPQSADDVSVRSSADIAFMAYTPRSRNGQDSTIGTYGLAGSGTTYPCLELEV